MNKIGVMKMNYQFKASWAYKVQNYRLTPVSLRNIRQEMEYINNISGDSLRILLSNKYNSKALVIRSLYIYVNNEKFQLTLNGKNKIKVAPFTEVYTDELSVNVEAKDTFKIEANFGLNTTASSVVSFYSNSLMDVRHYNFANREVNLGQRTRLLRDSEINIIAGIARVEIFASEAYNIAAFGDSLTHNSHWTTALQNRIQNDYDNIAIENIGQGGNRLLHDANTVRIVNDKFGVSGLNRVRNDVFQYSVPDLVIVSIGINDLIHPGSAAPRSEEVSFEELKTGYIKLHGILDEYNTKTAITTITQFNGYPNAFSEERETIRNEINDWIRNQHLYDMVIDTDQMLKDPKDNTKMDEKFDGGDHLHFGKAGGEHVANSIDLQSLLKVFKN